MDINIHHEWRWGSGSSHSSQHPCLLIPEPIAAQKEMQRGRDLGAKGFRIKTRSVDTLLPELEAIAPGIQPAKY